MSQCQCRFEAPRPWRLFALLLALLPACCAPSHPAPKPAEPAAEILLPPPPPPPAAPARPVLHAAWSFQAGSDACIAVAKAGATSLAIDIRPEGQIHLDLAVASDAPARPDARFNGPAGHWLIQGTHAGRRDIAFVLDRTEASLSRILILLSGGMLYLEPPAAGLPALALPESGPEGQQWFACARRNVI